MDPREAQALENRVLKQVQQILALRDRAAGDVSNPDAKATVQQLQSIIIGLKDSFRVTSAVVDDLSAQRQRIDGVLLDLEKRLHDWNLDGRVKTLKDALEALKTQLEADTTTARVAQLEIGMSGLAPRVAAIEATNNVLAHNPGVHPVVAVATAAVPVVARSAPVEDPRIPELQSQFAKMQTIIEHQAAQIADLIASRDSLKALVDEGDKKVAEAAAESIIRGLNLLTTETDAKLASLKIPAEVDLVPVQTRILALEMRVNGVNPGNPQPAGIGGMLAGMGASAIKL